ncbi:MAG: cobalt ECF transporter T component CbiQ [Caldilineales bacterium]|nr:cobalt ECF transporter T component CbiQ [Caldilineales bacterium]MDW8316569.1 cobalt ECF transporter T component CbiQ [Anaerolineae bacterium]
MHLDILDQYRGGASPVHRLDPRVKLVCTVAFILVAALMPDGAWGGLAALAALWLAAALFSEVPLALLLRRGLVALPFALAALTVLFTVPGEPLVALSLGRLQIAVTDAGAVRFATILLKSWLSVLMAVLLAATTTFPDIVRAMHSLRVPGVLVAIIAFAFRYLFVLGDEALRLLRAREARMAAAPAGGRSGGSIAWRAQVVGQMAGSLFVRSIARSERVYHAMASRGYRGELRWLDPPRAQRWDWAVAGAFLGLLLLIGIVARVV